MNNDKKENLLWWLMMIVLMCLLYVFQYKDTPKWTDAIRPILALTGVGLLLRAIFEFYFVMFGRHRLNMWSFFGLGTSVVCLFSLWYLGSTIKGLFAIVGLTFAFAVIVLLVNWIKERMN